MDFDLSRPREHLVAFAKKYPGIWKIADTARANGVEAREKWPSYCFMPGSRWTMTLRKFYWDTCPEVYEGMDPRSPESFSFLYRKGLTADWIVLAVLGTWRMTQGIYRFDADVYREIVDTPVSGDIPCSILQKMPEWCVYIPTTGLSASGEEIHGFFATHEWFAGQQQEMLCLMPDTANHCLVSLQLPLGNYPLSEALNRSLDERRKMSLQLGGVQDTVAKEARFAAMFPVANAALSLLLYLCSQAAEYGGDRRPANPQPKRVKNGLARYFPPDKPTTWDVGVRMGAALRQAYAQAKSEGAPVSHGSPRAHVRRAHWHGYHVGPMKTPTGDPIAPDQREFELQWLPPIPVNVTDLDDLPATIRAVERM